MTTAVTAGPTAVDVPRHASVPALTGERQRWRAAACPPRTSSPSRARSKDASTGRYTVPTPGGWAISPEMLDPGDGAPAGPPASVPVGVGSFVSAAGNGARRTEGSDQSTLAPPPGHTAQ